MLKILKAVGKHFFTGDVSVESSKFLEAVHVNYGEDPYFLVNESIKILQEKKGTFSTRENKQIGLDGAHGMLFIMI